MSKAPSLISCCNGKPEPHEIGRATKCSRCEVAMVKGTKCARIPRTGGSFKSWKIFCLKCLGDVLTQTRKDLDEAAKLLQDPAAEPHDQMEA